MIEPQTVIIADQLPEPLASPLQMTVFSVQKNQLENEFKGGKVEHVGKGIFRIDLPVITCTGSDVTQYFMIPFHHRILRMEVKHTDSSYADSVNALTYSLKMGATVNPALLFAIVTNTATIVSDTAHLLDFPRTQSRYQLITNSTNTELLYVALLIELEEDPDRGD